MCDFDVRNPNPITRIIFADTESESDESAFYIDYDDGIVWLGSDCNLVKLSSREDVANLIKALHKAEELGWI